jgi:hypothetical protein
MPETDLEPDRPWTGRFSGRGCFTCLRRISRFRLDDVIRILQTQRQPHEDCSGDDPQQVRQSHLRNQQGSYESGHFLFFHKKRKPTTKLKDRNWINYFFENRQLKRRKTSFQGIDANEGDEDPDFGEGRSVEKEKRVANMLKPTGKKARTDIVLISRALWELKREQVSRYMFVTVQKAQTYFFQNQFESFDLYFIRLEQHENYFLL